MAKRLEKLSIELNLEETSVLCHLLLPKIMDQAVSKVPIEFQKRMFVLYKKLTLANDQLMGKS